MKKNLNMTEKQIIDRLDSINLSLRQKKDLIDIIKDITASSGGGGGGTSTDKDALYIYLDPETEHIIINDKEILPENSTTGDIITRKIHDEELYYSLYNSLFNTNKIIYLKSTPHDSMCFFSEASYLLGEGNYILIDSYMPSIGNIFIRIYRT